MDQRERKCYQWEGGTAEIETWCVTGAWSGRATVYLGERTHMFTTYSYASRAAAAEEAQTLARYGLSPTDLRVLGMWEERDPLA